MEKVCSKMSLLWAVKKHLREVLEGSMAVTSQKWHQVLVLLTTWCMCTKYLCKISSNKSQKHDQTCKEAHHSPAARIPHEILARAWSVPKAAPFLTSLRNLLHHQNQLEKDKAAHVSELSLPARWQVGKCQYSASFTLLLLRSKTCCSPGWALILILEQGRDFLDVTSKEAL